MRSDNAAVDEHGLAVHPRAVGAAKRRDRVGDIGRLAQALVGCAPGEAGKLLLSLPTPTVSRLRPFSV